MASAARSELRPLGNSRLRCGQRTGRAGSAIRRVSTELDILEVSTLEKSGGAARIAWYLHDAYCRRGLQSWMAVGRKESEDPAVFEIPNDRERSLWTRALLRPSRLLEALGTKIRGASLSARIARAAADPMRYRDIHRGVEDFHFPGTWRLLDLPPDKPDIVNCHNLHGSGLRDSGYFDLRVLPWLSSQAPVVLTLQDAWLLSGHCAHSMGCEKWKTGCGRCPDLRIPPAIRRDSTALNWKRKRDIYSRSRVHIVTPSHWLMRQVEASMLAPAVATARVIHNGLDLAVFRPGSKQEARVALNLPPDLPVLLFVGVGTYRNPFKDYATMENALTRVAGRRPGSAVMFVCLGEHGAERSSGKARIRFVPYEKDPAKVPQFYQAADMYLHAAYADTFPNTVLEALACGTPAVATSVGGIPEQIEDGETGFLTPPRDAEAMAARIEQLLADGALRQRMGAKAAEVARERFSLDRQVDEYLSFFSHILTKWQSAGQES